MVFFIHELIILFYKRKNKGMKDPKEVEQIVFASNREGSLPSDRNDLRPVLRYTK